MSIEDIQRLLNVLRDASNQDFWIGEEDESLWPDAYDALVRGVAALKRPYSQIIPPSHRPNNGQLILYFHYDFDYRLIYIGKSRNVNNRQHQHMNNARWWREVHHMEFAPPFESQGDLDAAEVAAIKKYQPKYNIADNPRYGR